MWEQQSLTWRMPWSHWILESPPRPLSQRQTQMRSWSPGWSGSRRRRAVGTRCLGTPNGLMLVTRQYVTRGVISNYLLIISTRGVWVENYSLKVSWHRHLTQGCLSQMKTKQEPTCHLRFPLKLTAVRTLCSLCRPWPGWTPQRGAPPGQHTPIAHIPLYYYWEAKAKAYTYMFWLHITEQMWWNGRNSWLLSDSLLMCDVMLLPCV